MSQDKRQAIFANFWDEKDAKWAELQALVRRATVAKLDNHGLFAEVVARAGAVSAAFPYRVEEVFKLSPVQDRYLWFSNTLRCWVQGGPNGGCALRDCIQHICQIELSPYLLLHTTKETVEVCPSSLRWDLSCEAFKAGVEKSLRAKLLVPETFELDPRESMRFLNFEGKCLDTETGHFVDLCPSMLISRSTGWHFEEPTWAGTEADALLEQALAATRARQDERGLDKPAELQQDTLELFDRAAEQIPELKFWYHLTKDWEVTVYELSHLSRAAFGIRMAEALWTRGPGRNGKDTVCNILQCVLGSYVVSIGVEALCKVKDPDSPTPCIAKCRARRVVCVREVTGTEELKAFVYKRFTDPNSTLQGRDLYEKLVFFKPQHLVFFASNQPMKIAVDLAVRERTSLVEHVSIFKDSPVEANDAKWQDIEQQLVPGRPSHFRILWAVFRHLLRHRPMRNVRPVPQKCLDLKELEVQETGVPNFDLFLQRLKAVNKAIQAACVEDVRDLLASMLPGEKATQPNPSDVLASRGFAAKRTKHGLKNVYVYLYAFCDENGCKKAPQFVALKGPDAS